MEDPKLEIGFLDHVAITVEDMDRSIAWYQRVLGLHPHTFQEWGDYPVFMLCGKTGVAIFPAEADDAPVPAIRIHHFAFNVDQKNFDRARKRYENLNIRYDFQDHHFFHSIYTFDPDGHRVELTCIQVPEADFYK
jgi:catechol 2,3-dioxygenase-like lactoylglutathione lyase family enzyme